MTTYKINLVFDEIDADSPQEAVSGWLEHIRSETPDYVIVSSNGVKQGFELKTQKPLEPGERLF